MKILIIAEKSDCHAVAVQWGLRALGYEPIIWSWSHFPNSDLSSCTINSKGHEELSIVVDGVIHKAPFDVIWHRRAKTPIPCETSHPFDHKVILREAKAYLKNVTSLLGNEKTKWINPVPSLNIANDKIHQLTTAAKLGFKIPDTLIGNDFEQIENFYLKHNGNIIYKAFTPGGWYQETGPTTVLRTSKVTPELMEDSASFTQCPGIFQEQIDKLYEIRVTVIGDEILAAKIDSQINGDTIDWRYDLNPKKLPLKKITLPKDISDLCIMYCKQLDLAFGCIDLILNKSGEYVFLEINESGQFLWKEDIDPTLRCLSTFCKLIANYDEPCNSKMIDEINLADFYKSNSFRDLTRQKQTMIKDSPLFSLEEVI